LVKGLDCPVSAYLHAHTTSRNAIFTSYKGMKSESTVDQIKKVRKRLIKIFYGGKPPSLGYTSH